MYLLAFLIGTLGLWLIQLGARTKSIKQEMDESITPKLKWLNSKDKSLKIYYGIVLLIAALIIFLRS